VQKLVRAGFGNNNVDTCARVCHSPTGYGLKTDVRHVGGHPGLRLGRADRRHLIIGANPTDAHPVFASRMKKRLRQGAKLIVIDPRRIDLVRTPHIEARYHLPLRPGTNVAILNALAHVIVTEGLVNEKFVRERCDLSEFEHWAAFVAGTPAVRRTVEPADRRVRPMPARRRPALRHSAATARSTTASASPSTARARRR
jgi:formate dehydrogenase major subunit